MTALYAFAIFVSAALLFLVEPLVGKLMLPLLGSSPAVWTTTVLFFQLALLAGYALSLAVSRLRSLRIQVLAQLGLLAVAAISLPLAAPSPASVPNGPNPVLWLLGLLAVTAGLPFLALAANGPTLQRWLAESGRPAGRDPYFLFAASNAGSLLGLLAFPLLLEPRLTLHGQGTAWTVGYAAAAASIAGIGLTLVLRRAPEPATAAEPPPRPAQRAHRARWVALAAVPSSLMLGTTTHMTRDISPVPLLWVVPLAVYLMTFVVAFAPGIDIARVVRVARIALPGIVIVLVYTLAIGSQRPLVLLIVLSLLALAAAALVCHAQLAAERPHPSRLTEFYLWVALGGVLGGVFNALVAPLVFPTLVEYPLALVAACLLRPAPPKKRPDLLEFLLRDARPTKALDLLVPLLFGAAIAIILHAAAGPDGQVSFDLRSALIGLACGLAVNFARRPVRFALAIAAILLVGGIGATGGQHTLARLRSFFGAYKVVSTAGGYHLLFDGTTLHGEERLTPGVPGQLTYYARAGPVGQAFAELPPPDTRSVAVIGLGAGALACYARAGTPWTFYEVDPVVAQIARNRRLFTYLSACPGRYAVVIGDGRRGIARAARRSYGLVAVDAFNSDAIPEHLITREALELYFARLRPGGAVLFHISNRYLNLEPVLANLSGAIGLTCRVERFAPTPAQSAGGVVLSKWALLVRAPADLGAVGGDSRWRACRRDPSIGVWTDSYSDIVDAVSWG